jgi:hypothetical protein
MDGKTWRRKREELPGAGRESPGDISLADGGLVLAKPHGAAGRSVGIEE